LNRKSHVEKNQQKFSVLYIKTYTEFLSSLIPSQLLENRPDIKQAELELAAAKLDVKVARANFYPSLDISAGVGLKASA
jgi:multidrug efflux system outer membrane protein